MQSSILDCFERRSSTRWWIQDKRSRRRRHVSWNSDSGVDKELRERVICSCKGITGFRSQARAGSFAWKILHLAGRSGRDVEGSRVAWSSVGGNSSDSEFLNTWR